MEEIGRVLELKKDKAIVSLAPSEVCHKCRVCFTFPSEKEALAEAENAVGAKVGDTVQIVLEEKVALSAIFILYVVPLLFFFLGYIAGALVQDLLQLKGESIAILNAFIFLGLSFFLINRFYGPRSQRAKKFSPIIKKIISSSGK
jgi:sigma-E factor negative regulatory protein RseC